MKKITLVIALAFCLVLFAGCTKTGNNNEGNGNPENTNVEQNIQEAQDENLPELTSLYKNGGQLTCKIESTDENGDRVSMLYIDNDKLLNHTTYTKDGEETRLNVLVRDGKNYVRGDVYGEGKGLIIDAEATVQEQVNAYEESDTDGEMECTPGIEGVNFDLPSDIKFSGINSFTY